jgi:hypothetical protein
MPLSLSVIDPIAILEWDAYLFEVSKAGGLKAMIGGGAIRDRLLGITPHDIDIFYEGKLDYNLLSDIRQPVERTVDPNYDVAVERITDATGFRSEIVNLLECKSVEDRFCKFAANISKVYYTRRGLILTPAFMCAVYSRQIIYDEGTSEHYKNKMMNKFRANDGWIHIE